MNYRWSKNDRRMMQEVIDYFKVMLGVGSKEKFLRLANSRKCPFCANTPCEQCRITKCFKKFGCMRAFPAFHEYWRSIFYYNRNKRTLPELKSLLRDAIKELEPWGAK